MSCGFLPFRPVRRAALAWGAAVSAAILAGCAAPAPMPDPSSGIFLDERFAAPSEPVDPASALAVSEDMRRYLQRDIALDLRRDGPARALINALYHRDRLQIDYDAAATRNAAQTFAARKGNCLSLVLMTAAFAKELKLQVTYQVVADSETWSRRGDLAFLNTHVNLTLTRRRFEDRAQYDAARLMTVDFLPAEDILGQHVREIEERKVVAMYLNNRAAESLAGGAIDDAYWWARAAIVQDPAFVVSYNTLGVIYLRHGDLDAAGRLLREILRRDPRDAQALSNLAIVLARSGERDQAEALRARLAQLEPEAPYHYFFLGRDAMRRGDYQEARRQFAREVERAGYNSEFHFWLGMAELRLGDLSGARREISEAMADSLTETDRGIYAAKLDKLRAVGMQ